VVALPRRPARQGAAGILGASNTLMNIILKAAIDRRFPRLISPVPGAQAPAGRKGTFHFFP